MKVLIAYPKNEIRPVGGPSGYLYNLDNELMKSNYSYNGIEFNYLQSVSRINYNENNQHHIIKSILKSIIKFLTTIKIINSFISSFIALIATLRIRFKNREIIDNIDSFDIIHFHSTFDLYKYSKQLKLYKGLIILNSHSPIPTHQEILDSWGLEMQLIFKICKFILQAIDLLAYKTSNYMVFPNNYSIEPYLKWSKFSEYINDGSIEIKYLISGIKDIYDVNQMENYDINSSKVSVCYVGRQNYVKGFDIFVNVMEKLIKTHEMVVNIAGKKNDSIVTPHDDNWINHGFIENIFSFLSVNDIYISTNRETYFDLIVLEAMCSGKVCILSYTGGNKYFQKYSHDGLLLYDNKDELIKILLKLVNYSKSQLNIIGMKNREIFKEFFSSEIFTKNYSVLLKELYKDHRKDNLR
jgi:glycosyltransferase involved in cell wall biosynthesis